MKQITNVSPCAGCTESEGDCEVCKENRRETSRPLRILVACEESQEVCKAFRAQGHEAYSCDLKPCSGGHPEWHIQDDLMDVLLLPHHTTRTQSGTVIFNYRWDRIIAFPPCTHIAVSGARHFAEKRKDGRQRVAIEFFLAMWEAPSNHIAIENPVGIMSGDRKYLKKYFPDLYERAKNLPKPQMIQPWQFGHPESKKTCLWLKGLPELKETKNVYKEMMELPLSKRTRIHYMSPGPLRAEMRSKTYPGIARAMTQWSEL